MELACTQHTVSHSTPGADWGRKAALAYTDEAAHFWECPRGTHPRLQEGSWRFDKFLENDLPNGEESRISDDLIHLQKRFMKAYTHLRCSHLCNETFSIRKPCCRKETSQCHSCSFRFFFADNIHHKFKSSHASKAGLQS